MIRTRFGLRLGWPIANAATFVLYLDRQGVEALRQAFGSIMAVLLRHGYADEARRLFVEPEE